MNLTAAEPVAPHPADLTAIDRPYLVPWGAREIFISVLISLSAVAFFGYRAATGAWLWWVPLGVVLAVTAAAILFFRNPRRIVPSGDGTLVAPADGTIWDVSVDPAPEFVGEPCLRIGIFLSIFNVHVNRAPCAAEVAYLRYRPGAFHDARSQLAAVENESHSIGFVGAGDGFEGERLLVKQISGAVARRILCPLRPAASVARGGLVGMIKYGSRTELYVPERLAPEVRVRVGQSVTGGETILVALRST